MLEAVADYDKWIWHSFFGTARSHNEIDMLQHSPVFSKLVEGHLHHATLNCHFADCQESCREDVQHAFGVLQA
jgi:hypothetical protein